MDGIPQADARGTTIDRRAWIGGLAAIAALALAVYWPSLTGGFLWDDDTLLTNSAVIKASDGLYRIWFTTQSVDYWPVTNSSFWLEWRLWGMNATGYHVTNLLLHTVNASLLWAVLRRLRIPGAFLAALLFVVHPVNVQSVAWIAERKNTLSMAFYLLSVLGFLRWDEGAPRRALWFGLSLIAFILAALSKGSVVMLPLVLLLIAWWKRNRLARADLLAAGPFFAAAGALTIVNLWFRSHGADDIIRHASAAERLEAAGAIIWFYLYKAVLPLDLAFVYPLWDVRANDVVWWLPLIAVLAVTGVLVWQRRQPWARATLFAWVYVCVTLVPVLGFADTPYMKYSLVGDHYQYLALPGVLALVAAAAARAASPRGVPAPGSARTPARRRPARTISR